MSDEREPSLRRLMLAAGLLSLWLVFLFVGATLGGAIHLALLGVLALRPWRLPSAESNTSDPERGPVP